MDLQSLSWTKLLLLVLALWQLCTRADCNPQAEELKAAINADYKPSITNWDHAVVNNTLSNIKLEHIAWSEKPRRFEFTVFTQLSIDRLQTLYAMCTTFTGPLSAAVFLALVQPPDSGAGGEGDAGVTLSASSQELLRDAVAQVQELHARVEADPTICQLDLMLFYEIYDSEESKLLYPVNYLRNYARMQVRTRLLAMIDVDLYISRSLSDEMSDPQNIAKYEAWCAERRATVLPAFEPSKGSSTGIELALEMSRATKSELESKHRRREIIQFKLYAFSRGHAPTDYAKWFGSDEPYKVKYKRFYEPWFITCEEIMPWYDISYRGYGLNKIILLTSLNYYGYTFWVHPDAWVIHSPHKDTDMRKMVLKEATDINKRVKLPKNALYQKLLGLFGSARYRMTKGTYKPLVDPRMMAVYDKVFWLRPPPQLVGKPTPHSVLDG